MAEGLLLVHQPGQAVRRQPLPGSCYRIGRGDDADVVIDHSAVSRRHALLENTGGHWLLSDRGSTNGIWWRGRRVERLLLRDGDSVRFGPSGQGGVPEITFVLRPRSRWQRLTHSVGLALAAVAGGGLVLLGLAVATVPIRGSLATVRGPLLLYDRANRPIASVEDSRHRELARLGDFGQRPRGMHQQTYERILDAVERCECTFNAAMVARFGPDPWR